MKRIVENQSLIGVLRAIATVSYSALNEPLMLAVARWRRVSQFRGGRKWHRILRHLTRCVNLSETEAIALIVGNGG